MILKLFLNLLPRRPISLSWDVYPVPMLASWSRNYVFKVNKWRFLTHGFAKKSVCQWHRTRPHTDAVCLGGFLKPVSHISEIFEFCFDTFSRLLFFYMRWLQGYPSIKLASNWSKENFRIAVWKKIILGTCVCKLYVSRKVSRIL